MISSSTTQGLILGMLSLPAPRQHRKPLTHILALVILRMDPLSITSAAVSLAGVVFTVATKVKEISDTLTNAPQAIWDIADEVLVLQAVLKQVERLVKRDPNSVERLEIDDVFKLTVKGCHATLLCISKEYQNIFTRFDWKARILALWKHGEMEQLLLRLARKKADLGLLIEMLNL